MKASEMGTAVAVSGSDSGPVTLTLPDYRITEDGQERDTEDNQTRIIEN